MVDEMDDKLLLATFHNGVSSYLFIHKLYDQKPQTMVELVHSSQSFMNANDAIIVKKRKKAERMEADLPISAIRLSIAASIEITVMTRMSVMT